MTNEELAERLRNWDICSQDDYEEAANRIEKMNFFLRHNAFAEQHFGVYFICGEYGEKDINGMPEQVDICAAYGSDAVYTYSRAKTSE